MKIEDKRKATCWVPALDILETIIPLFRTEQFVGLKRIVLMDSDYNRGPKGRGIYKQIPGTNQGEIEIYFDYYEELPDVAKSSQMYLTYLITDTLMHEVYHHNVRTLKKRVRPSNTKEEMLAQKFAKKCVDYVFFKLFHDKKYSVEWDSIMTSFRARASGTGE